MNEMLDTEVLVLRRRFPKRNRLFYVLENQRAEMNVSLIICSHSSQKFFPFTSISSAEVEECMTHSGLWQ